MLSFPHPLRFLFASRPEVMGRVLGIVYRVIAGHLIRSAGFTRASAQTGAVTLIQRFGSALNLNVHFHMLFLDGVYVERPDGRLRFRWVKAPASAELIHLADPITRRVARFLERQGLLERDAENGWLAMTLCGPPPIIDACTKVMRGSGINDARVFFDKFLDRSHLLEAWPAPAKAGTASRTWPLLKDQKKDSESTSTIFSCLLRNFT